MEDANRIGNVYNIKKTPSKVPRFRRGLDIIMSGTLEHPLKKVPRGEGHHVERFVTSTHRRPERFMYAEVQT